MLNIKSGELIFTINSKTVIAFIFLTIFCFTRDSNAKEESPPKTQEGVAEIFWSDVKDVYGSPLRLGKEDLFTLGAYLTFTGTLFAFDEKIKTLEEESSSKTHEVINKLEPIGNGIFILSASGLAYSYGKLSDDEKLKETAFMAVESFLISGSIVHILKNSISRKRPSDSENSDDFSGPQLSFSNPKNSFPSGHTAAAFSSATVIAENYDNIYIKVAAYTLASVAGMQRIYGGVHWASDVFVGGTIGYLVGKNIVRNHKNKSGVKIYPEISSDGTYGGIKITMNF